jgi:hypothetical protein
VHGGKVGKDTAVPPDCVEEADPLLPVLGSVICGFVSNCRRKTRSRDRNPAMIAESQPSALCIEPYSGSPAATCASGTGYCNVNLERMLANLCAFAASSEHGFTHPIDTKQGSHEEFWQCNREHRTTVHPNTFKPFKSYPNHVRLQGSNTGK